MTPVLLFGTLCHNWATMPSKPQIFPHSHSFNSQTQPILFLTNPPLFYLTTQPFLCYHSFSKPATATISSDKPAISPSPSRYPLQNSKNPITNKKHYLGDHSKLITCTMKKGFMSALRLRALHAHTCVSLIHDPCKRFCQMIRFDYTPIKYYR